MATEKGASKWGSDDRSADDDAKISSRRRDKKEKRGKTKTCDVIGMEANDVVV